MKRMQDERDAEMAEERAKEDAVRRELSEIRKRYEDFKYCKVSDEAMRAYAIFMKDKMTNKQYRKEKLRDLGLAAIDSHVVFAGMARNDSTNVGLVSTNDNRASLVD